MVDCTKRNVRGGLIDTLESGGIEIEPGVFNKMPKEDKVGYAAVQSERKASGTADLPVKSIQEQNAWLKAKGFLHSKSDVYIDPVSLFGDDFVKPIVKAQSQVKAEILANGLSREQGLKLYRREVVPNLPTSKQIDAQFGAGTYQAQLAKEYVAAERSGGVMFNTSKAPLHIWMAKNVAGNITGMNPVIAGLDFIEFFHKSATIYGPHKMIQGLAIASKDGLKMFGRTEGNQALYHGMEFAGEKGKVRKGAEWLLNHTDPQYYSNNFLVNASAGVAKAAGVPEAEAVRKIAFIKEPGNTPQYLMNASNADIVWARYSTEAFKFYADTWANVGRAYKNKDSQQMAAALHGVIGMHVYMGVATGSKAMMPLGSDKLVSWVDEKITQDDVDPFEYLDEVGPFNLMQKLTGLDVSENTQIGGLPAFGLAFSAYNSTTKSLPSKLNKAWEAMEQEDYAAAAKYGFYTLSLGLSAFTRNPLATKAAREITGLVIDGSDEGYDEKTYVIEAADRFGIGTKALQK